jgi:signal transduction histidine kinase
VIRAGEFEFRVFEEVARLIQQAFSYPDLTRTRITFDDQVFVNMLFDETPWRIGSDIVVGGKKRGGVDVFFIEPPPGFDGNLLREGEQNLIEGIAGILGETIERREAEANVIQASKLASIGELAAGVGHEINNPTNGIINCADLLIKHSEDGSRNRRFAELIRAEADRIASIVRNLLTFARQGREQHTPARLCDVVSLVLSLSGKKIAKSNIDLRIDVPETLPKLRCRSEQLQQVVMNLIINAMHALDERFPGMDSNKILAITAKTFDRDGRPLIRLTVEDHGSGIAPANLDRIFDPFFTTKGRDKGTGLGLSVSDGIVKDHGGAISLESEVGRFTRFHVDLPLDAQGPPPRPPA